LDAVFVKTELIWLSFDSFFTIYTRSKSQWSAPCAQTTNEHKRKRTNASLALENLHFYATNMLILNVVYYVHIYWWFFCWRFSII